MLCAAFLKILQLWKHLKIGISTVKCLKIHVFEAIDPYQLASKNKKSLLIFQKVTIVQRK